MRTISGGWVSETAVVTRNWPLPPVERSANVPWLTIRNWLAGGAHREDGVARVDTGGEVERGRVGAPRERPHVVGEAGRQLAHGA